MGQGAADLTKCSAVRAAQTAQSPCRGNHCDRQSSHTDYDIGQPSAKTGLPMAQAR